MLLRSISSPASRSISRWWTRSRRPPPAGAVRPGEPLPSIRPLAEELRVNRNTIAKAYAELESQGVIETIPGKGCFVKANHSPLKKEVRQQTADRGD